MPILDWKLLGEVTIDTSNKDLTLAETGVDLGAGVGVAVAVALTQGRYADARVLCNDAGASDIASKISGVGGAGQNYTVVPADATGRVTIATSPPGGNTFAIVWTDTDLRDLLGFAGNLAGAATYTGGSVHRNGLYPAEAAWWRIVDDSEIVEALTVPDQGGLVADFFHEHVLGELEYRFTPADELSAIRTLWEDVIRQRRAFNLYPDRTVNTAYSVASNTTGYRRWKLHESVTGFATLLPHRPYSGRQHIRWKLRGDPADAEFVAVGT